MKSTFLLALFIVTAAQAQEYRFKNQPFESGSVETNGKTFQINTMNYQGNLCELSGSLKNHVYQDPEIKGCTVKFNFQRNKLNITATEACQEYCGNNAHFAGYYDDYYPLPAACTDAATKRSQQRFQAAYRAKRYAQAVKIQQSYLNTCGDFLFITEQMRARNDLAIAQKNSGNKTACRATLQPLRQYWNDTIEDHSYVYRDEFMKQLAAAKFNWNRCR